MMTFTLMAMTAISAVHSPITLHPENPHYFLFRGKPTVLITSGEHYGAVLNLDFDYVTYLDTLQADGLNHTRTFSGAYVEHHGAFNIAQNTLAPVPGRFICPWVRSETPGYLNGGNKFDLTRWDEAYFERLRDFLSQASDRGIVVEMNLFCPFYSDEQWQLSPMNPVNNINEVGPVTSDGVYTLTEHGGLLPYQEAMVRKIVTELNAFDNLYYEVMNEPYIRNVPLEWEHHIVDVIVATERELPNRHLISMNIANGKAEVTDPHPAVSILNFHYANPPATVAMNYHLNRVIGDNETGFRGTDDTPYRVEAWEFMLAGGGLFNNLDYSFTVGHEDGTFEYPDTQPGGGSATLRRQLRWLKEFLESFEFIKMRPSPELILGGVPEEARAWLLAEAGQQYALYITGADQVDLELDLPEGTYNGMWFQPMTGKRHSIQLEHPGGCARIPSPQLGGELALRLVRAE